MAQYIITIDDQDNKVSVSLTGPSSQSPAYTLAAGLVTLAPHLLGVFSRHQMRCGCERCQTMRAAKQTTKTTLH